MAQTSSPITSGDSTPISYRANVNRQKTKKWAEATTPNYGGDDWGDAEEADLYMAPEPASKPTGRWQQSQSLPTSSGAFAEGKNKKTYGGLEPATTRARTNSFTADDEKRDFSSSTIRQVSEPTLKQVPLSGMPATRFSQMGVPMRSPVQAPLSVQHSVIDAQNIRQSTSPIAASPQTLGVSAGESITPGSGSTALHAARLNTHGSDSVNFQSHGPSPVDSTSMYSQPSRHSQPGRANTGGSSNYTLMSAGSVSSTDFHERSDYSPSAVPHPLSTRGAAANEAPRYPGRKSSLGQSSAPVLADISLQASNAGGIKPLKGVRGRSPSPGSASRPTNTTLQKALPFVRPADIYKGMEEHRMKERQSLNSLQPSPGSMVSSNDNEALSSYANRAFGEKAGLEESRTKPPRALSSGEDNESVAHGGPVHGLEPVKEWGSEYGVDSHVDNRSSKAVSDKPKIPLLKRLSGFGEDLFSSTLGSVDNSSPTTQHHLGTFPASNNAPLSDKHLLHNEVSLGFRPIVHQSISGSSDDPTSSSSRAGSDARKIENLRAETTNIDSVTNRAPSSTLVDAHDKVTLPLRNSEVIEEADLPRNGNHSMPPKHSSLTQSNSKIGHPIDSSKSTPEPVRPDATREQSFRPSLPGGWVSYAPSTSDTTPMSENVITSSAAHWVSEVHSEFEDETSPQDMEHANTAPRTSKHSFSDPAEAAKIEAFCTPPKEQPTGNISPCHERSAAQKSEAQKQLFDGKKGAANSITTSDPQNLSPPEPSPQVQIRPNVGRRNISTASILPPAPLPKDTPSFDKGSSDDQSKAIVPPKTNTRDSPRSDYSAEDLQQSLAISTTINVEAEHDKLSKDIVQSLSPRSSAVGVYGDKNSLVRPDDEDSARESTYFPSEYESYWATTSGDGSIAPLVLGGDLSTSKETRSSAPAHVAGTDGDHKSSTVQYGSIMTSPGNGSAFPPPLQSRSSWELSEESVSRSIRGRSLKADSTPGLVNALEPLGSASIPSGGRYDGPSGHDPAHIDDVATLVSGVNDAAPHQTKSATRVESSLMEENRDNHTSGRNELIPPDYDHPSNLPENHPPPISDPHPHLASVPPPKPHFSHDVPFPEPTLQFKDIILMSSPQQRIKAFEETRMQYATMSSTIGNWTYFMMRRATEHRDATSSFGGLGSVVNIPSASARSKLAKAVTGGQGAQQPYYQQYLNASTPSIPASSKSGPPPMVGAQQGFQVSKTSTQQVQARGKELLHTAGVFGGKAGKAGKGLLAKGKSKLKGAGGEKAPNNHLKSIKKARRASWGLGLNITRPNNQRNTLSEQVPRVEASLQPKKQSLRRISQPNSVIMDRVAHIMTGGTEVSWEQRKLQTSRELTLLRHERNSSNVSAMTEDMCAPYSKAQLLSTPSDQGIQDHNDITPPTPTSPVHPASDPWTTVPIIEEVIMLSETKEQESPETREATTTSPSQVHASPATDKHSDFCKRVSITSPAPASWTSLVSSGKEAVRGVEAFKLADSIQTPTSDYTKDDLPSTASDEYFGMLAVDVKPVAPATPMEPQVEAQKEQRTSLASPSNTELAHKSEAENHRPKMQSILDRPRGASINIDSHFPTGISVVSTGIKQPLGISQQPTKSPPTSELLSDINLVSRPRPVSLHVTTSFLSERDFMQTHHSAGSTLDEAVSLQTAAHDRAIQSSPMEASQSNSLHRPTGYPRRQGSFKGLPPIRRTSTFGFGLGSRQASSPASIDNNKVRPEPPQTQTVKDGPNFSFSTVSHGPGDEPYRKTRGHEEPPNLSIDCLSTNKISHESLPGPDDLSSGNGLSYALRKSQWANSLDQPRRSLDSRQLNATATAIHALKHYWDPNIQHSQITDLPSRCRANTVQNLAPNPNTCYLKRNSMPNAYQKAYAMPLSTAQSYPQLFHTELISSEKTELPPDYGQRPISRAETLSSTRQEVGHEAIEFEPPVDPSTPSSSRRNSFLKDIEERTMRSTSDDRGTPTSPVRPESSCKDNFSPDSATSASIRTSDEVGKKSRQSGLFSTLARTSTGALVTPKTANSTSMEFPASRGLDVSDSLRFTGDSSSMRRSMVGLGVLLEPQKMARASSSAPPSEAKKNRFSNLRSIFGRNEDTQAASSNSQSTILILESDDRPTGILSPAQQIQTRYSDQSDQSKHPRKLLDKLSIPAWVPQSDSRSRTSSATGYLSGFLGKRGLDEPQSRPLQHQVVSSEQNTGDLQPQRKKPASSRLRHIKSQALSTKMSHDQPQGQDSSVDKIDQPSPSRAHILSEPQYDSVPIPDGYQLVHAQGGFTVATQYDPRGLSQTDPELPQPDQSRPHEQRTSMLSETQQKPTTPSPPQPLQEQPTRKQPRRPPSLGALETYEQYQKRSSHTKRVSSEDLLARSPARIPKDQQPPYHLLLPKDSSASSMSAPPQDRSTNKNGKLPDMLTGRTPPPLALSTHTSQPLAAVLPTPALRHPQSPAGYPLPSEGNTFNSSNEVTFSNAPSPPIAPWPEQVNQHLRAHQATLAQLERSHSKHSTVSQVSKLSASGGAGLGLPSASKGDGKKGYTSSPSISSAQITPRRSSSPSPAAPTPPKVSNASVAMSTPSSPPKYHMKSSNNAPNIVSQSSLSTSPMQSRVGSPDLYDTSPKSLPLKLSATPDRGRTREFVPKRSSVGVDASQTKRHDRAHLHAHSVPASPAAILVQAVPDTSETIETESVQEDKTLSLLADRNLIDKASKAELAFSQDISRMQHRHESEKTLSRPASGVSQPVPLRINESDKEVVPIEEGLEVVQAAGLQVPGLDSDDNDESRKMSATSYPGMEWNPYGELAWIDD